jgi:hypothetical protein
MTTSLIPERPILISPTLAATIGLKEAILLHVMSELILQHSPIYRQNRRWAEISMESLAKAMPFWESGKIKRVITSLQELGMLLTENLQGSTDTMLYAINQHDYTENAQAKRATVQPQPAERRAPAQPAASLIPPDWTPDETLLEQCRLRNIPLDFIRQEVPAFVQYWRDRQKIQYSWHNTFLNWVVRGWESKRTVLHARSSEEPISPDWQPSEDALGILELAGISMSFIEDAIPEFILFWREKGIASSEWNTRFIAHIRRQWDRFMHALEHDTAPRMIPADFTPSPECYDILAMANIDLDFADAQLGEFILYWQDRRELHASWNTKFLQHVKYKWAQQLKSSKPLLEKITDRSWAD